MTERKHLNKNAIFITRIMAMERYNLGRDTVVRLAREAGALIKYGNCLLIDAEKCDSYLRKEYTE